VAYTFFGWVFEWPSSWGISNGPELTLWAVVLAGIAATAAVADALADLLRAQTRPEPVGPLGQLAAADGLAQDTRLRLRAGLHPSVRRDGAAITLQLLGRRVTVPALAGPALEAVLSGAVFTAAELPAMDGDAQLVLCRRLLREGVVVPA
jgi:hypothetical protein